MNIKEHILNHVCNEAQRWLEVHCTAHAENHRHPDTGQIMARDVAHSQDDVDRAHQIVKEHLFDDEGFFEFLEKLVQDKDALDELKALLKGQM